MTKCPKTEHVTLRRNLRYFKSTFKIIIKMACYQEDRFLKINDKWLKGYIKLDTWTIPNSKGRPSKDFGESSCRSKRRKMQDLRNLRSTHE